MIILLAVLTVVGTFFIIANSPNQPHGSGIIGESDPVVLSKVTTIQQSVFANVGTNGLPNPFKAPAGNPSPLKGPNGKPEIFYYGTEWCPLCAAERWSMTIALSRFGTFKSLPLTISADASTEPVMPNIPTFSFHGANYSSNYIDFVPVELETRTRQPLDNPTADQQQILAQNNVSGYPFIDIANKFIGSSGQVDPTPMKGLSQKDIANMLSDPKQGLTQQIVGAANYLTAAICAATDNQPNNVCNSDPIPTIRNAITTKAAASVAPFTIPDVNYVDMPALSRKRTATAA